MHTEDRIQQDIVIYLNNTYCLPAYANRGIVFHVPNQRASAAERIKLKAMGVLAGVSDIIFIYRGKHLYLEVKTPDGIQSKDQKEFEGRIQSNGFSYYIVRSVDDVINIMSEEFKS